MAYDMNDALSVDEALERDGYTLEGLMEDSLFDRIIGVPTVCPEGCEVEPDGHCQHGFPSILLAAGMI